MTSSSASEGRELLFEIGCEEIPAGWLAELVARFRSSAWNALREVRLVEGQEQAPHDPCGTPRRLVAAFDDIPACQPDATDFVTGPPWRVARNGDGWTRAAVGFAKRHGVAESEMDDRLRKSSTPRGDYVEIAREMPGKPAIELLPKVLESALRSLPFPKNMQWDATIDGRRFSFGRPIRWIVALFGGEVIPFQIDVEGGEPVAAGNLSRGHRFRTNVAGEAPGAPFPVSSLSELMNGLRERCVILGREDRFDRLFKNEVPRREEEAGAKCVPGLVAPRLSDLAEWPGALLCHYPDEFLSLPTEIRYAVLVHHQKCIPIQNRPAFVAITNSPDDSADRIRDGIERVVLARLRDARFFWESDRRERLTRRSLKDVAFHRELGSYEKKAFRIERLAGWLATEGADCEPRAAAGAARLAKRDLTTALVGEFPELQGVIGGLLLEGQDVSAKVWMAVRDHYLPDGLSGGIPETTEGRAVALADRADTLAGLFLIGMSPTGSRDPFGLRRAALSMLRILHGGFWPSPARIISQALDGYQDHFGEKERSAASEQLRAFVLERLPRVLAASPDLKSRVGIPGRVVRAVLAVRGLEEEVADTGRLVRHFAGNLVDRSREFEILAFAANRIRGILEQADETGIDVPSVQPPAGSMEPAESNLQGKVEEVEKGDRLLADRDYLAILKALAELAPFVDDFFDKVLVMTDDRTVRARRLALLKRLDALFFRVGDLRELQADRKD